MIWVRVSFCATKTTKQSFELASIVLNNIGIVCKQCLRVTYLMSALCNRAQGDIPKDIATLIVRLSADATEPDAYPL